MDKYVDFLKGDVIKISHTNLIKMEHIASSNIYKKRYRICLHDTPDNRQHEMFICMTKDDYNRPHKHVNISETHLIIEGTERIVLFDDEGRVTDTFLLDRISGIMCYRINSAVYHMSIPLTDIVIEMEVKGGPFSPKSNIWAPWAPDGKDSLESKRFVRDILEYVENED